MNLPHAGRSDAAPATRTHSAPGKWDAVLCIAVVAVCILLCRAYVEAGFIDDFSYVHTAWSFARTGHFRYFGWSAVPLIVQTVCAWPFLKVLGFSYFACRVTNQVFFLAALGLFHAILRRAGLNRQYAFFGTLVLALSPLAMALASSFMSDVCALFLLLLGVYCGMKVVDADTPEIARLWLLIGFGMGILGVTERQTIALTGAVVLPCAVWVSRYRRQLWPWAAVLFPVNLAATMATVRWFAHQPQSQDATAVGGKINYTGLSHLSHALLLSFVCLCFLLLPVGALAAAALRRRLPRKWAPALIVLMVVGVLMVRANIRYAPEGYFPFLRGVLLSLFESGALAARSSRLVLSGLSVAVFACVGAFLWADRGTRAPVTERKTAEGSLGMLLLPLLAAYAIPVFVRGIWSPPFDRYLLPMIALVLPFLLRRLQGCTPRVGALAWLVLVLVSGMAIAGTHDWAGEMRARLAARQRVLDAGVPITGVMANFQIDGDTEIRLRGSVTNGSYVPVGYEQVSAPPNFGCALYNPWTADIRQKYEIMPQLGACEEPSVFGEVDYRDWLPPFHRRMMIAQVRDSPKR